MLLTSICCYAQKAKLELKLQQDSIYYLTISANMNIDQNINGTHQIVKTTITGKTSHKVTAIRDTLYDLEVKYKNLGIHMDIAGRVIDFNSDVTTDDVLSKAMRSMIDKPFTIVISKTGRIVEVKNTENLFEGMFDGLGKMTDEQKTQMLTQLRQSFGEKTIKGNLQEAFVIFPKTAVNINGTWTGYTTIEAAAISIKTKTTYILNNISSNSYDISGTAIITNDKNAAYRKTNGYNMRLVDVNGTNTTTLKINKRTGWITETHVKKHIKASVELKKELEGPIDLTYPMEITADLMANADH